MKPTTRTHAAKRLTFLTSLAILGASLVSLHGEDTKTEVKKEEKKKKWESTATVGVTLTRGNSKNFLATGALGTKRTWAHDEALLGASAGYGENTVKDSAGVKTDTTTDSYLKGFGQWNHLFSPRFYGGLRLSGDHD